MSSPSFDPLTATASSLQYMLENNSLTSVQIIDTYLQQIDKFNHKGPCLNALISVAPRDILISNAESLDEERRQGKVRSPLHGIPIILKDNIMTHPDLGLDTTVGSWAFVGAKPKKSAELVDNLIHAGVIILGKANMTEFCGLKAEVMPGWSAVGGQTLSPYVGKIEPGEGILGHSAPGGSSSGSAAGVAAGFAPFSVGTDTIGSLVTPGCRAAVYAIKPSLGFISSEGMFTLSIFFDSAGPMTKSARDLIPLLETLSNKERHFKYREDWSGLSIGFGDPDIWNLWESVCPQHEGTVEQMKSEYEAVIAKMRDHGVSVSYPVDIPEPNAVHVDGRSVGHLIAYWEFKNQELPKFIQGFAESKVHSLADIIEFNASHKDIALPEPYTNQDQLINALKNDETGDNIIEYRKELRRIGIEVMNRAFDKSNVNILAVPADSGLTLLTGAAGAPIAIVPLGSLKYNGRPFGLCIAARPGCDEELLQFMTAYETLFPGRVSPARLQEPARQD